MFSEGFHFKKTAWHARLMRYIWGFRPQDFSHMCPYFWLSVLNFFISPVVLPIKFTIQVILFKGVFKGIFLFFKWLFKKLEQAITYLGTLSDKWAKESQKRYEEQELKRVQKIKEAALEKIMKIPADYRKIIAMGLETIYSKNPRLYYEVKNFIPEEIEDLYNSSPKKYSKELKKWKKWYKAFIKFYDIDKKALETIVYKADEIDLKEFQKKLDLAKTMEAEKTKGHEADYKNARAIWAAKLESNEEKQKRLLIEASKLEQEELRKSAKKLKEQEDAEKKRLRMIAKKENSIKNKQRINKILKIAKPIMEVLIWVIGGIVAIFGLLGVYKLLTITFSFFGNVQHKTYSTIGEWLLWGLIIVASGTIAYIIIFFGVKAAKQISFPSTSIIFPKVKIPLLSVDWEKAFKPFNSLLKAIYNILAYIWKMLWKGFEGLAWPFVQFWKGIVTLGKIIKQTYKNECPPIYWEDDKN